MAKTIIIPAKVIYSEAILFKGLQRPATGLKLGGQGAIVGAVFTLLFKGIGIMTASIRIHRSLILRTGDFPR